jgi:hypothetical protein
MIGGQPRRRSDSYELETRPLDKAGFLVADLRVDRFNPLQVRRRAQLFEYLLSGS